MTPVSTTQQQYLTNLQQHSFWVVATPLRIDVIDEALRELDIEEDTVDGLYTRVEVTTQNGTRCWAYAYGTGLDLTPIPSGNWFDRPPRPQQQSDS